MPSIRRRTVLKGAGALTSACFTSDYASALAAEPDSAAAPTRAVVTLKVNGRHYHREIDLRTTLLDAVREHLKLTGAKKGCDHGQCGACTMLVNHRRINACLTLAVMHEGDEIITIEGVAKGEALHPLQRAFIAHDGFQCGYCTPGQICSAIGMMAEAKRGWASHVSTDLSAAPAKLSDADIRERMSGNICRCGAYAGILAAIRDAGAAA